MRDTVHIALIYRPCKYTEQILIDSHAILLRHTLDIRQMQISMHDTEILPREHLATDHKCLLRLIALLRRTLIMLQIAVLPVDSRLFMQFHPVALADLRMHQTQILVHEFF